jgi:tRNA (guanine-N7-)-methyltransferase
MYQQFLKPDGVIHLKTDSQELMEFTREMVAHHACEVHEYIKDIYINGIPDFPLNIKTHYETMHLEDKRTISYIRFSLPKNKIVIPPKKVKDAEEETI